MTEIIVHLIEVYNENRLLALQEIPNLHQSYVSKLNIVDEFDKLLTRKEFIHYYTQQDLQSSPTKINIILALFSYINFENQKGLTLTKTLDPNIAKYIEDPSSRKNTTMQSEEEASESAQILYNLDVNLTKNLFYKSKYKNCRSVDAISTIAIRILTKLVIIWDEQIPQRKPVLYEYIAMITQVDNIKASKNTISVIESVILDIFFNYESQTEDVSALLEFFIACLYSQRTFIDIFLKPQLLVYSRTAATPFFDFLKSFIQRDMSNYKGLLFKLVLLIYEIFQREIHYASFAELMRKNGNLLIKVFTTVFEIFEYQNKIHDVWSLLGQYGGFAMQASNLNEIKNLETMLEKLVVEGIVMEESSLLMTMTIVIRFITQELLKSSTNKLITTYIKQSLRIFFEKYVEIWVRRFLAAQKLVDQEEILNNLNDSMINADRSNNIYDNQSLISMSMNKSFDNTNKEFFSIRDNRKFARKTRYTRKTMEEERSEGSKQIKDDRLVLRGLYKIMDINLYGYGKDFLYDTQEIFFALKSFRYVDKFIVESILFLQKENLRQSLRTIEYKCFESGIRLFKFITTLGLDGQCFSSIHYNLTFKDKKISSIGYKPFFDLDRERALLNPNHSINFEIGFPSLFSKSSSDSLENQISHSVNFLVNTIKDIWKSLRDSQDTLEYDLKPLTNLEQKINFMAYCFHGLLFLIEYVNKNLNKSHPLQTLIKNDKRISEAIAEIFNQSHQIIWSKVSLAFQKFQIDISNYLVFLIIFNQCMKEADGNYQINKEEIRGYLTTMETFLSGNSNCLSLIITCIHQIWKLFPAEYLEIMRFSQGMLTRMLIGLMNTDKLTLDIEFPFIIKFFIDLAKNKFGALHLRDCNIVWEITQSIRFKNIENVYDYENGARSTLQIHWCWLVLLQRQLIATLNDEPGKLTFQCFLNYIISGFINTALGFLKEYTARIFKVLDQPTNIISNITGSKPNTSSNLIEMKNTQTIDNSQKFTLAVTLFSHNVFKILN